MSLRMELPEKGNNDILIGSSTISPDFALEYVVDLIGCSHMSEDMFENFTAATSACEELGGVSAGIHGTQMNEYISRLM